MSLRIVEECYEVKKEDRARIIDKLRADYKDKLEVEETKDGIRTSGEKVDDWIVRGRIKGLIANNPKQYMFSDNFHVPKEFDGPIRRILKQRFGDRYRLRRARKPPTEFARATWQGCKHTVLFVFGDFKDYDEVIEMIEVVERAIMDVIKENVNVVVQYRKGKAGVARYAAGRIKSELDVAIKMQCGR